MPLDDMAMTRNSKSEAQQAPPFPPWPLVNPIIEGALREDLGGRGDITSDSVVSPGATAHAVLRARRDGCIAGLPAALAAFRMLNEGLTLEAKAADGQRVKGGDALARIDGQARAILTAERTALNLLCHLSGVATATAAAVDATAGTFAKIVCTRKTTPGLRVLEKYAVAAGGGSNHRFGLDDAVLIKDNHIVAAGGLAKAFARAKHHAGHMIKIEVEVDTLEQLDELLPLGADAVLLDNMPPEVLRQAVNKVAGRMITEASGGITPERIAAVAASGVDLISLGWLTHSAPILDIGLDFETR